MSTAWRVGAFDVEILCDGTPVRIEMLNSVVYAVIPNGASYFEKEEWETDPFGEPFSQSYRYTPFQVKVTDLSYEGRQYPVYALLYLDGSRADTKHILDKTHIFKGFRTNEGVTQFCFSPPRVGNANSREGKRRHLHPSLPAPAPSLRIALTCKNVKPQSPCLLSTALPSTMSHKCPFYQCNPRPMSVRISLLLRTRLLNC